MDLTSVSAAQQSALSQQISVAVLRKSLDATRLTGDAVNGLLESTARLGKSLATGLQFDAQA